MCNLRDESLRKCFSLLREFIRDPQDKKKETALFALDQLQQNTAETDTPTLTCAGRPKVHG